MMKKEILKEIEELERISEKEAPPEHLKKAVMLLSKNTLILPKKWDMMSGEQTACLLDISVEWREEGCTNRKRSGTCKEI